MVTPNSDLPKPAMADGTTPVSRGPPSPTKHPRPTSPPQAGEAARQALSSSASLRPPGKMRKVVKKVGEMPDELQTDISKQAKIVESSRKLAELSKERPLFPFSMTIDNQNDVYLTQGMNGGDVVFKPGTSAMLNKMCDGIARMLGLGNSIPLSKAGQADVVSKRDLHLDPQQKVAVYNEYQRLTNLDGNEVLVDLESEAVLEVEDVAVKGGEAIVTVNDRTIILIPKKEGGGLEVCDPYTRKSAIEEAAEKSNKFVALNQEGEEEAVFLAAKASLGQVTDHKTMGKVARVNDYIYKVVSGDKQDVYTLKELDIAPNKGKKPDAELLSKEFSLLEMGDEEGDVEDVLAPKDELIELDEPISKESKAASFTFEGKAFKAVEIKDKPGTYKIAAAERDERELPYAGETVTLVEDEEGNYYLLPKEEENLIVAERIDPKPTPSAQSPDETLREDFIEKKEFVIRNGQKYAITDSGHGFHITGHNIKGMVQSKVENIFTKPGSVKRGFDIKAKGGPTEALIQDFFHRVDMEGFIDAFLLTILIRPQDGRIDDLATSNVLFQAIDDGNEPSNPQDPSTMLRPVLIDLDETMPAGNAYSLHNDFLEDGWDKVHCVRCGLMAFPQARKPLRENEMSRIHEFANILSGKKKDLATYLKTYANQTSSFNKENIEAFMDVVEKTLSFIQQNKDAGWTLESLFFHVFPEYKKQWDMLKDDPPEIKAFKIGSENETDLKPRNSKA